jgi:hypothetical protein
MEAKWQCKDESRSQDYSSKCFRDSIVSQPMCNDEES